MIPKKFMKAALKAMAENRLWWRVADQHGRPSNGGDKSARVPPIGVWAPRVEKVCICSSGYHVTKEPHRWRGCRVWLVEIDEVCDTQDDKAVCHTYRALAEVDPDSCVDMSISAACQRAYLQGAYLQGAYLRGAYLRGADLQGAFYDRWTVWPSDFELSKHSLIKT